MQKYEILDYVKVFSALAVTLLFCYAGVKVFIDNDIFTLDAVLRFGAETLLSAIDFLQYLTHIRRK